MCVCVHMCVSITYNNIFFCLQAVYKCDYDGSSLIDAV